MMIENINIIKVKERSNKRLSKVASQAVIIQEKSHHPSTLEFSTGTSNQINVVGKEYHLPIVLRNP